MLHFNFKKKIMQKNWYVVRTKPGCEKRVAASFHRKKIEYFFPEKIQANTSLRSFRKKKDQITPLFSSYVFVHIDDLYVQSIKLVDGVVDLVYWQNEPAKIQEEEIGAIREFATDYQNIRVEKSFVDLNGKVKIIDGPQYLIDGNLLSVKNSVIKINLPTLGFVMTVEFAAENSLSKKVAFGNKILFSQS